MNVSKLTAAVLTVLVVSTGVGAVAATPGNGNASDDTGTNAANAPSEEADANATAARDDGMSGEAVEDHSADAADGEERRGLPADLPDHVGEIHQRIASFVDGELDTLGAAVSDVTPADDSEEVDTDGDAEAAANAESEADTEPTTEEPTTDEPETKEPETESDSDSTETATATLTTEA